MKKLAVTILFILCAAYPALAANGDPVLTAAGNPFLTTTNPGIEGKAVAAVTGDLSLVAGTAFVSNPSLNLALLSGKGYKLTFNDGAQNLVGWIKAAGTGETYGLEVLANPSFDANTNNWTPANATLASVAGGQVNNALQVTQNGAADGYAASNAWAGLSTGQLLKISAYVKSGTSGNGGFRVSSNGSAIYQATGTSSASWAQSSFAHTKRNMAEQLYLVKNSTTAGTMLFDEASVKPVSTASTNGVTIKQAADDDTENWTSNGGINANAASFTVIITRS